MSLEPAHAPQPALVVVAALGHVGPDLGVGEDEEALLADRLDDRVQERMRYVLVCDKCESEVRELDSSEYRPRFEPAESHGAAT